MIRNLKISGIGADLETVKDGDNVTFTKYLVDRPMPLKGLLAAEAVVDICMTFEKPVGVVWPIFKNFNLWMNRYGYVWSAIPADEENGIVYLGNRSNEFGTNTPYVIRKVIPECLIYLESLPHALPGKNAYWTGHNVVNLREVGGRTVITSFMEHTFFSHELPVEELRKIAADLMFEKGAIGFWRNYFIPDLRSLIER
jgi:hypothetical protein